MGKIRDAIYGIAVANGYDGDVPETVRAALNALTDTLAGEDVDDEATIAKAIETLGSYVAPVPSGKKTITANGTDIDVSSYATVDVATPVPTGKLTITENGTDIDVSSYATVDVAVQAEQSQ